MNRIKVLLGLAAFTVVFFLGMALAKLLRKPELVKAIQLEKDIILAKAAAAKMVAEKGRDEAVIAIKKQHEERLATLDEDAKNRVEDLSHDPKALVDYLLRVTLPPSSRG